MFECVGWEQKDSTQTVELERKNEKNFLVMTQFSQTQTIEGYFSFTSSKEIFVHNIFILILNQLSVESQDERKCFGKAPISEL